MVKVINIETNENLLLHDKLELKIFLKFLYGNYPKKVDSLIGRDKPYKGKWLFRYE